MLDLENLIALVGFSPSCSQPAEVPLGLDDLLLLLDLDLLLGDGDLLGGGELGELLLGVDQLVVLVGAGLGGHGVEDGGDGLALDDRLGEVGGRGGDLGLLVVGGLLGHGVEDGGDGLALHNGGGQGGHGLGRPGAAEGVVGAGGRVDAGGQDAGGGGRGNEGS